MTGDWTHEYAQPIPAPAARIFDALTSREELEQWFAEHARIEPGPGGAFRFWGRHTVGTPAESDADGAITALEPGRLLAFDWTVCGVPSQVTLTLTDEEEDGGPGTKVTVRHQLRGLPDAPRPKELIDDWWRFSLGNLMLHTTGRGRVLRPDFADPHPEVRISQFVDAPREAVFRALTEPDALREWMHAPNPVVELRVGGRYSLGWRYEQDGKQVEGGPMRILELVPDEKLAVSWPDWRGDTSVPMQSVTWLLEAEGTGTRVTVIHAGFTRTVDISDYPFGWGHFISAMARVAVRYQEQRQ